MDTIYAKCAKPAIYAELQEGLEPFVYWHVTESIQEGYDPEAIGELQETVEVEAFVLERRCAARNRVLGYFISLLRYYLVKQTEPVNLEAALNALQTDLAKESAHTTFDDFHLDTAQIYEYVEEQKQNAGHLADDPAWHRQPKTSEKMQWNNVFKNALDLTRNAYVAACKQSDHRFKLGAENDLALCQLLSIDKLNEFVLKFAAAPRHVPASPQTEENSSATTSSFWSQRIGSQRPSGNKTVPLFDPVHLVEAGQHFRAASIEHIRCQHESTLRLSGPEKDFAVIISQALNLETNPERLIERAHQRANPTKLPELEVEAEMRSAKELLSSALRILGIRDGERNVTCRIQAYNLRGYINLRLADLKPQHETNYLSRAISDWSVSKELDPGQHKIVDVLAQTEARLESLPKIITESSDKAASSTDSHLSKHAFASNATTIAPASTSTVKAAKKESTPTASAANGKNERAEIQSAKPREKTILESPFFRSDLVTGLMVDALLALAFPHRAFRKTLRFPCAACVAAASQDHIPMLDRHAKSHQQTTKALTEENKAQLKVAVKCVSAVLALPDLQQKRNDSAEKVMQRTSLRLVLGTLHMLLGRFVKAQTELELISNALKPNMRGKTKDTNDQTNQQKHKHETKTSTKLKAKSKEEARPAVEPKDTKLDKSIQQMQTRVQGQALFLLARTCWMTNKVQEAVKFFRWFVKWYSEQQALAVESDADDGQVELDIPELDMSWWDKVVVVTKQ
ncbi:uncharacterized protein MEPE_03932 [Melanopsichium pennsylvanicum]|uniref:Uncharacterized protein n=2 Tax=Melanopsichium pennsylvanicum TaxID=63383 RepID=A0AAJ4XQF4_9BASI|nr:hypothetical protein BN887_00229 [Melanopsichium pennsylvanicum 4]SNX85223.1 uncharacterized protein MEPE_03932 [Melanopsichium pennsylvanicum]